MFPLIGERFRSSGIFAIESVITPVVFDETNAYSFSFDNDVRLVKAAEKLKVRVATYINAKKKHTRKEIELIEARRNFESANSRLFL